MDQNEGNEQKIEEIKVEDKKPEMKEKEKHPFFKNKWGIIILVLLILILALSIYIRTTNIPQLKDVTTGKYTLGPDLDPFFFTRLAKEISIYGHPINPDYFRTAPVGVPASYNLHSYLIAGFYKFTTIFDGNIQFELAADIFPVIFFGLALVFFFLFLNKLFSNLMSKKKAKIGAIIATAFFAVMPDLIHRTVAGIPEHESSGIFFIVLALYLFICAWESKGKKALILSVFAGLSTTLAMSAWGGGAKYIFMIIGLTVFIAFLFQKVKKKEFLVYILWFIFSLVFLKIIPSDSGITASIKSISDVGFALGILILLIIDHILFETKLKEKVKKIKLPRSIISIIITIIIGLIIGFILKPDLISSIFNKIVSGLLHPFGTGRVGLTVAENKAPFLTDLIGSFSPIVFWLFFFGTIFIFYEAVKHFKNKKIKTDLLVGFIVFVFLFLFSRYSATSFLNGENAFSKFLYFAGPIIFIILLLYHLIKAKPEELDDFKNINFGYIFILATLFWTFVSVRGAIRLFFIIAPFVLLPLSFLPLKLFEKTKSKDELKKVLAWCLVIVIAILLVIAFIRYEKTSAAVAKGSVPSPYNQQWQKAMSWVRENTSQNAIFAHWWDYGYWVQSIGERPTILDGGHAGHGGFWNYLMGRYVLTAPNETDALEFLYAHNASYLLIDSTDIGKYSAYSSIGSDESGKDRLSWITTFVLDEKQTYETRNETQYVYTGGTMLDWDFMYQGQIFPMQKAGIGAFILSVDKENNKINGIDGILVYNGKQFRVPIRYAYINNKLVDINGDKAGVLQGCLYIFQQLTNQGLNNMGAAMYISEKGMNALWVKLYLFNEGENFELAHNEPALLIDELRTSYNLTAGDFLFAGDVYGPIKIWKIYYPKNFTVSEEKMRRYLSFQSDLPFPLW